MPREPLELTGRILFPGGQPAVNARVVAATEGPIQLEEGWPTNGDQHVVATTGHDGDFCINILREPDAPFTLYMVHQFGTAIVVSDEYDPEKPVELTAWLTVRGEALSDRKPSADTDLLMRAGHFPSVEVESVDQEIPPIAPMILNSSKARTSGEGKFRFDHVPARMEGDVHRIEADRNWGFCARFTSSRDDVGPIEPAFLRIEGCTVVGRFELPEVKQPIVAASVQSVIRGFDEPPGYDALPYGEQLQLYQAWLDSPEGQRAQQGPSYAQIQLDDRGSFCVRDVPPGLELRLHASVYRNDYNDKLMERLVRWLKREPREVEISHHFTLPAGSERYDLGTLA